MCYPEDIIKGYWDLFISLALVLTCSVTPYALAFNDSAGQALNTFDLITDSAFGIDVIIIFNTAFYDSEFNLIDNYPEIACTYIRGWLLLDLIAIIPFNYLIQESSHLNHLARIFRIGKMYKLVKLLRLVRVIKIIKQSNKFFQFIKSIIKIGQGFERLLFFIFSSFLLIHIFACLWIFFS